MKIGILDYGAGNLKSVENALTRLGAKFFISDNSSELEKTDKILFPGVGHAASAMRILREKGLDEFLQKTTKPVLGICLGMQLLFDFSEEGETECLGIIPGKVRKFDAAKVGIVPHMGWNEVDFQSSGNTDKLNSDFYFVHSYFCDPKNFDDILATTEYSGFRFCSGVRRDNFLGVQFHPEKSGKAGEEFLKWFLEK